MLVVNGSAYDLLAQYVFYCLGYKPNKNKLYESYKKICNYLDDGYTYEALSSKFKTLWRKFTFNSMGLREGNLLKQGEEYFHKELLIRNQMPINIIDVDKGTIKSIQEEFYVEQRASYTLDDLCNYIKSKFIIDGTYYTDNRLKGILRKIVIEYGIDVTLFCVEEAVRTNEQIDKPYEILQITNMYSKGRELYKDAVNNFRMTGGERYVRRKRLLPLRSG